MPLPTPTVSATPTAWRCEPATRASLVVDAADYFEAGRLAMLGARQRIMLLGWDFDARIQLTDQRLPGEPETLGDFMLWLVERNPALEIYLLRWNIGALRTLLRGPTLLTVLRWMAHPRIHTRLDAAYPPGASHHHKIVVVDDAVAFCGGIDMTSARWDTREHRDDDPRRVAPDGTPYGAWHEAAMVIEGRAAAVLGDLARTRWREAGGRTLPPVTGAGDCWPQSLPVHFRNVPVAIARSRPGIGEEMPILEVEQTFLSLIASARRHIYAESQYFASRRIAEAIADRLTEPDGPEIVVVNPLSSHGWLEPIAMDTARARLVEFIHRADRNGRFRLYHPVTALGRPVYVHSKILVVDDQVLHVGSSNMNNRSLRLDTECDVTIDALRTSDPETARAAILGLRDDLVAEHLGVAPQIVFARIAAEGSLIAAVEALRGEGRSLRPYEMPTLNGVETWLADNELLDPEGPDEMFKPFSRRGLLRRLRWRFRHRRTKRRTRTDYARSPATF
jgi:phosphatidylserine/phosphatidylglycerophosphate/cardiolipin synthase-like enzyme